MNEPNQSLRKIFNEAVEIADPQQQADYLASACGADTGLRQRIEGLITADTEARRFLGGVGDTVAKDRREIADVLGLGEKSGDPLSRRFGDYELLEEIARGGMGIVYKARQVSLDRIVAVKLLLLGQYASEEFIHRFRIEASAAASLQHPNIVAIHEVGVHQGQHYFAMDFVDGPDLAQLVREKPLTAKRAAGYVKTIAEAIHFAHTRRILHRDLKPSNVLIDSNDQPRVTDFGLAKNLGNDSELTLTGQVMGSPGFMPPEQALGDRGKMGPTSDVYSLGAILYHALTGRAPFVGQSVTETLQQVQNKEPIAPRLLAPSVPVDLETVCLKCLERDPGRRFASAQELADELGRFLRGEIIHSRPVSAPEKIWRWCRRKPALAAAAGAAFLLFLVIVIGSPMMTVRISGQRQRAEQQTQRAQAALTRVEIERAESMFAADSPARAIASLAYLLRQAPTNRAVAERLLSALNSRNFCLPSAPPLKHNDKINSAQFSPDGQLVVTASRDGTARVWEIRTGQPVGEVMRHAAEIKWARFSSDNRRVVTASTDGTARIWEAQTGQPVCLPLQHQGAVNSAAFSPDGRRVVTGSRDKTLRLWDAETGRPAWPPITNKAEVYFVHFSPSGDEIIAAINDGTARIFSTTNGVKLASFPHIKQPNSAVSFPQYSANGKRLVTLQTGHAAVWDVRTKGNAVILPHRDNPVSAVFSSDGELVATGSRDNTARIWNARTGEPVTPPIKNGDYVLAVQFSPDGNFLLTGGEDKAARLWDVRTRKPITEPLQHNSRVRSVQFSPDGQRTLTVADGNEAALWQIPSTGRGSLVLNHDFDVRLAVFSPDGRRVATASWDNTARVWDAHTGLPLTKPLKHKGYVDVVRFSPDGERVAIVSEALEAQIWNATTGEPLIKPDKRCTSSYVFDLQFSPDGRRVAMGTIAAGWIWDAANGEIICQLRPSGNIQHVAFSPDGQRLVTTSSDGTGRVWDANTGNPLTQPLPHDDKIRWAEFSPDGKRIVTAGHGNKARIWDSLTGQMISKPIIHPDVLGEKYSVQFGPDGRRVVTAAGQAIQVWNAQSGEPLSPRMEHRGRVTSVRFSLDGKRLVTAVFGGDSRVWDAATGHPLSEPLRHREGCYYAEFSPDGQSVVTASADGTARIWLVPLAPLPTPAWLPDLAEALVGRRMDTNGSGGLVPVATLFKLTQQIRAASEDAGTLNYYSDWARTFFAEDARVSR